MGLIQALMSFFHIVGELLSSLWHLKRWWAPPLVLVLVILARRALMPYLQIIGELLSSSWHLKRWWVTPLVLVLVVFALLFVLASTAGIAPFIYTLF